jgi:ferredoxin
MPSKAVAERNTVSVSPGSTLSATEDQNEGLPAFHPSELDLDSSSVRATVKFYHNGAQKPGQNLEQVSDLFPALLQPYRDEAKLSMDYPLWVAASGSGMGEPFYRPLKDLLNSALEGLDSGRDEVRILRDNLGRIELSLKNGVRTGDRSDFVSALGLALSDLEQWLGFSGERSQKFLETTKNYSDRLPDSGEIIAFSSEAPVHLFLLTLRSIQVQRQGALFKEIQKIATRLQEMLTVERGRAPSARMAPHLSSSLGLASSFVDSERLANLIPESSSEPMSEDRRSRIEVMVGELEGYLRGDASSEAVIVAPESLTWVGTLATDILGESTEIIQVSEADPCAQAAAVFDEKMKSMSRVLGSLRLARLEVENQYREELHGDFRSAFSWRSFTKDELALCPPVLVVDDEALVFERGEASLSSLLLSGRLVQTLILNQNLALNWSPDALHDSLPGLGRDLGEMAVSHRRAFVLQSSSAQPNHLVSGFLEGLSTKLPALYRILTMPSKEISGLPSYLWCNAAHESRAFPSFIFNPKRGDLWGSRFDIGNNLQPEEDWPYYETDPNQIEGEIADQLGFTWADFASKIPGYDKYFKVIPKSFNEDDLLPMTDYLLLASDEQFSKLPYIWMLDDKGKVKKVLVSKPMVLLCQESLDAWHRLQDLGGARSYHAILASKAARYEAEKHLEECVSTLKQEHREELEMVRSQATHDAMERLSYVLMNLGDLPAGVSGSTSVTTAVDESTELPPSTEPQLEVDVDRVEDEDEDLVSEEAWIETFRCTTCNECTNLNPNLFKYNADKQAYIADINAGTYEDLILAAEKCSTKIIHPGKPLNQNEPNLEALIKRAEPFF